MTADVPGYITTAFWVAVLIVLYAYAGYPVVLMVLGVFRAGRPAPSVTGSLPKVSLLISAYNEAAVIEDKLVNSLDLDYPRELLEIVVVSDASCDGTDDIVRGYEGRGVVLKTCEGHIGKTACLNRAVPEAAGDVIVFSDANSRYDRRALRCLVERFSDRTIGFVTGRTEYTPAAGDGSLCPAGLYTRIEGLTKALEGRIGSCVGADGAIFAIRKSLYQPLDASDINDLVIPVKIVEQGYRGVMAPGAFCIEPAAPAVSGEFARHVRITTRSLRAIFTHPGLMNPFRYPLFSFELVSHKLIRFLVPFALFTAFFTNVLIAAGGKGAVYGATLFLQACLYTLWLAGSLDIPLSFLTRPSRAAHTFCAVNLAMLVGWIKFLKGEKFTTWAIQR